MNSEEQKREEIKEILREKISEYVENEDGSLESIISTCNAYDGRLEDYYFWEHSEEFYDTMFENREDVARAVYYASEYNYTDEYIKLNVYGNCETMSAYDYYVYINENKEEIIEEYIDGLFEDFSWFIQEIGDEDLRKEIEELSKIEVE